MHVCMCTYVHANVLYIYICIYAGVYLYIYTCLQPVVFVDVATNCHESDSSIGRDWMSAEHPGTVQFLGGYMLIND